ncbi:hypothetical protein [Arhodomonas sp. AD133]|uniref:hypothetical protein n=1 Tax=Arhodomonas sp. AD133 TaxID=3415009 RepID=UPI003EBCC53D
MEGKGARWAGRRCEYLSFGGWKRSRLGVLHAHGPEAERFYTRMETVSQRWPKGAREAGNQFVMPTMV